MTSTESHTFSRFVLVEESLEEDHEPSAVRRDGKQRGQFPPAAPKQSGADALRDEGPLVQGSRLRNRQRAECRYQSAGGTSHLLWNGQDFSQLPGFPSKVPTETMVYGRPQRSLRTTAGLRLPESPQPESQP